VEDIRVGEASDAPARDHEVDVAGAIPAEAAARAVGCEAVGLDDQAELRPYEVAFVAFDDDVDVGSGEAGLADEFEEGVFERALRVEAASVEVLQGTERR
jgi:hypothetical protein